MLLQIGISLGSNLGNRQEALDAALARLGNFRVDILKVSSVFETQPIGFKSENSFFNIAVIAETELAAEELLTAFQNIETDMGRMRETGEYSDRVIDLDLIFYGNAVINKEGLIVPHPRMHERLFVLDPLNEISPFWKHPVLRKTVHEMREKLLERANL